MATTRELLTRPVADIAPLVQRGEVSPVELVRETLERINDTEPHRSTYITVIAEQAMRQARGAEQSIQSGRYLSPYHGIPVGVIDLLMTQGTPTTAGSAAFREFIPDTDATTVTKLREAGAIIVGKHNLHELGIGVTSNNPTFGAVHNPWKQGYIPGGSSGGTAAAVAASECYAGLGIDTAGSIRIPAACCGVVGLKPTYGRVSRYGVFALSWSLDHVGPITRTVTDAALLLNVIAGYDPFDLTTQPLPVPDFASGIDDGVQGLRVGTPRNYYTERVHSEVSTGVENAIQTLVELGATRREVSLSHLEQASTAALAIGLSEATNYREHVLWEHAEKYAPDVRALLETGELITVPDYLEAQRLRSLIKDSFRTAMEQVDVIATPTIPTPAVPHGQETVGLEGQDEPLLNAMIRFTSPSDLSGQPTIAIQCGFTGDGLPVGLQPIGRPFDEATICRAAQSYEMATDWRMATPDI